MPQQTTDPVTLLDPAAPAEGAVGEVLEAMREAVIDPDLGINIVDLGFVYGLRVDEQDVAHLTLTLTSPSCPLTDVIEDQIRTALLGGGAPGTGLVAGYDVEWVWKPAWTPARISPDGREQLHAIGFHL